jgi:methionine-rich copper-binding protein CopC
MLSFDARPLLGVLRWFWYWIDPILNGIKLNMYSPIFFRVAAILIALAASQIIAVSGASAHAVIIASTPAIDAVVAPGDIQITLQYNSRIDHQRSRLTLVAPNGTDRSLAIATDSAPDVIMGKAADLAPGLYRLRWQVLAIDGHLTRGDIPFSVKAP